MDALDLQVAPVQEKLIRKLAPSLLAVADNRKPAIGKAWLEAVKGVGQVVDYGPVHGLAAGILAPGSDDARRRTATKTRPTKSANGSQVILRRVPRLAEALTVTKDSIECKATGSICLILTAESAQAPTAGAPDVVILEELVHQDNEEYAQSALR